MGISFDYEDYLRKQVATAETATRELCRILAKQGFASCMIDYSGGNDQGDMQGWFATPLRIDLESVEENESWGWREAHPDQFTELGGWPSTHERLEDGTWRERELTADEKEQASLNDLGWRIISGKWGGFAGDFEVNGCCWIDIATATVKRVDSVSHQEWETQTESY